MAIFHCYVSSPEGIHSFIHIFLLKSCAWIVFFLSLCSVGGSNAQQNKRWSFLVVDSFYVAMPLVHILVSLYIQVWPWMMYLFVVQVQSLPNEYEHIISYHHQQQKVRILLSCAVQNVWARLFCLKHIKITVTRCRFQMLFLCNLDWHTHLWGIG